MIRPLKFLRVFSLFCLFQNTILHKMVKLGFWNFTSTSLRIQFLLVAASFLSSAYLSWYLHLKYVSWRFNIYNLSFGDKSVRIYLRIWNQLPETLKTKWFFQIFKRSVSDWFEFKFNFKFVHLELLFFTMYLFKKFYSIMNKPNILNIHTNIIGIPIFWNGLDWRNGLLAQLVSILKAKL